MYTGFSFGNGGLKLCPECLKTWEKEGYAMSFVIIGKLFRKDWYISSQSMVKRTAQLVKIVRNTHTVKIKNKIGDFFIIFGGVLFNIISLIIVILIFNAYNPNSFLKGYYIGFTITLIISALIPVTYPNGYDSDGKNIFKLLIGNRK